MRPRCLFLAAALAATPASAATVCVSRSGAPACQTTIQGGVNVANPGDVVLVSAGAYFENVTVAKAGLTIRGANRLMTVIDASPNSAIGVTNTGPAFLISAPGVTIANLTVRNGQADGIDVSANDAVIQFVRFQSNGINANGIDVTTGVTGTQILSNEFRSVSAASVNAGLNTNGTIVKFNTSYGGGDDAFGVFGDSCVVSNNRAYQCGGVCFSVAGANAIVQFNTAQGSVDTGVVVTGTGALVTNNAILDASGDGIFVSGDGAVVARNSLTNIAIDGIYLTSNNASVSFNIISGVPNGYGISVSGASPVVASNRVTGAGVAGVHVAGASASVTLNTVTASDGDAIDMTGTNPTASRNRTTRTHGIGMSVVCSPGCTAGSVAYNVVVDTYGSFNSGIYLGSDAAGLVVEHNVVTRSFYESFYLDGVGHLLRSNLAQDQGATGSNMACYYVAGSGTHTLDSNSATRCSEAGFYIGSGSNNLIANTASYTYRNGFEVYGASNTIIGNRSSYSVGAGFAVLPAASSTSLTGNTGGFGNRTDYCDDGFSTSASGNSFASTAPNCDIVN